MQETSFVCLQAWNNVFFCTYNISSWLKGWRWQLAALQMAHVSSKNYNCYCHIWKTTEYEYLKVQKRKERREKRRRKGKGSSEREGERERRQAWKEGGRRLSGSQFLGIIQCFSEKILSLLLLINVWGKPPVYVHKSKSPLKNECFNSFSSPSCAISKLAITQKNETSSVQELSDDIRKLLEQSKVSCLQGRQAKWMKRAGARH